MSRLNSPEDNERKKIKQKMQARPNETIEFKNSIVKKCIFSSLENGSDWRPGLAAEAFSLLEKITSNLLYNPDRKMYHELKTYNGTYRHILSRLALMEDLLREIGYKKEESSFRLHRPSDRLESLLDDFLHAAAFCELMDDLYGLDAIEDRRFMCRVRLDPGVLEQQEARRPPVENGHRPSPAGRVKFVDDEPVRARAPRSPGEPAWGDQQLSRPRPRSILRHSTTTDLAAPASRPATIAGDLRADPAPPPAPREALRLAASPAGAAGGRTATGHRRRGSQEAVAGRRERTAPRPPPSDAQRRSGAAGGYRR